MSVIGTFCQICGMPVQHDCYIPVKDPLLGDVLAIYRGAHEPIPQMSPQDSPLEPEFEFKPEHHWLTDAVALRTNEFDEPQIMEGAIHDGSMEFEDAEGCVVWDGCDERAALHRACWELSNQENYAAIADIVHSSSWMALSKYHLQLFDFVSLERDGEAWMLVDPTLNRPDGKRNRERILSLLSAK